MNKKKIINDPIYGFVHIHSPLIYDIIENRIFQRLRRIKQLGITELVYPGALHTRFHHALGAMHLMNITLDSLRSKGYAISETEHEAAQIAILLHDIGHSPMSHSLEYNLLDNVPHEKISSLLMNQLNQEMHGQLDLAIQIFENRYPRKFLHQLVSSQLDMDRLDYLQRDSFFTGVHEGTIGADRIIKMLALHQDELVVEEKGIYSIENFLHSRRLMYWQVYLHKTSIVTEQMLTAIFKRVRFLVQNSIKIAIMPHLLPFLEQDINYATLQQNPQFVEHFIALDDYDVWASLKLWTQHPDSILAELSSRLLNRRLFKVHLSPTPLSPDFVAEKTAIAQKNMPKELEAAEVSYFCITGSTQNKAYLSSEEPIKIITKKGDILDIAQASDLPTIKALRKMVVKYYICWAN